MSKRIGLLGKLYIGAAGAEPASRRIIPGRDDAPGSRAEMTPVAGSRLGREWPDGRGLGAAMAVAAVVPAAPALALMGAPLPTPLAASTR